MKPLRSAVLAFAIAMLAGCGREPGVVDLSAAETYQRLVASKLPDLVSNRQCGILIHVTPGGALNQNVIWRVTSSGHDMVRITAKLTPLSESRTRVELAISSGPEGKEAYSGNQFYRRPAFNQPLRPAVEEQIAALLESRPYDISRVPRGTDSVCNVQRARLEELGRPFHVYDSGTGG